MTDMLLRVSLNIHTFAAGEWIVPIKSLSYFYLHLAT